MNNVIIEFLRDEIGSEESYKNILDFIESYDIRSGEFEGNRYIIKKMDRINFFVYSEDIYPDGTREISNTTNIYKDELIKAIKEHFDLSSSNKWE